MIYAITYKGTVRHSNHKNIGYTDINDANRDLARLIKMWPRDRKHFSIINIHPELTDKTWQDGDNVLRKYQK